MVREWNTDFNISEMGHFQDYFPGSGYGDGMKVKVSVVNNIKELEDGTMHMITKVTQNNSKIYGKLVHKFEHALESPGGLLKGKTAGSQNLFSKSEMRPKNMLF